MATKAAVKPLVLTFHKDKDTTNTVRYSEPVTDGERPISGSVYFTKEEIEKRGNPQTVKGTFEFDAE